MKRICIHWTAGNLRANRDDIAHYHRLVEGDGAVLMGPRPPEANIPKNGQYLTNEPYIAHCGGGNSWAIGWALCGMRGFSSPKKPGDQLLTREQFEAACNGIALDCRTYGIPVDADHVYTHYEFGKRNPNTSSRGKIDIIWLPFYPHLQPDQVGDFFRNKIKWYLGRLS
jgi:hypothetical protein